MSGSLIGSQDHLGDTFYTRYEQTIQSNQVSKIVGTKYNYLPIIHNVEADFLSLASTKLLWWFSLWSKCRKSRNISRNNYRCFNS